MYQAVILAGGQGTRLGEIAAGRPKPFVDINGKPFVDRLLARLKAHGITNILFLLGHNSHWVKGHYSPSVSGVSVRYFTEDSPMGTGGALKAAERYLDDAFILMNGDSIFDTNISALFECEGQQGAKGVAVKLLARKVNDVGRYGALDVSADGYVRAFNEKSDDARGVSGLINAGIYFCRKSDLLAEISGPCSLESDIFPKLVSVSAVKAVPSEGYFLDIGLPETFKEAEEGLDRALLRPAVIFDRDNTLTVDHGYTHKVEDLKWIPGAKEAILACNEQNIRVFVATNQAGIARGYYDEAAMNSFHAAMQAELATIGAHIDGFIHCPHHVDGVLPELSIECDCRKPEIGMLEKLMGETPFLKERSILIGDKASDVQAGQAFGIKSFLFDGNNLYDLVQEKIQGVIYGGA